MENEDPWAWMQPHDVRRFGEVIMDPKEQERWCRAVLLGGRWGDLKLPCAGDRPGTPTVEDGDRLA